MSERRDPELIQDIREDIARIESHSAGMTHRQFFDDTKTQDAVVRNLEILGEAAKGLSAGFRDGHRETSWNEIARMRDRLVHHYFSVNWEIVWDVIQGKLPELGAALAREARDGEPG